MNFQVARFEKMKEKEIWNGIILSLSYHNAYELSKFHMTSIGCQIIKLNQKDTFFQRQWLIFISKTLSSCLIQFFVDNNNKMALMLLFSTAKSLLFQPTFFSHHSNIIRGIVRCANDDEYNLRMNKWNTLKQIVLLKTNAKKAKFFIFTHSCDYKKSRDVDLFFWWEMRIVLFRILVPKKWKRIILDYATKNSLSVRMTKKIIKLKPFAYDSTRRIQKKWKTFWNVKQTITHDIHIYSNLKFSK